MKTIARLVQALVVLALAGCAAAPRTVTPGLRVVAVETFLADIAGRVAGDRLPVTALLEAGTDPHSFEPAPRDIARLSEADVLILNGAGFEEWLQATLDSLSGQRLVIEASAGLSSRSPQPGEAPLEAGHPDPHFWLDPTLTIHYVENIRDGLAQADPGGKPVYEQNAAAYIEELKALDAWIQAEVAKIPAGQRVIVTNHESFGYFADRYGFTIAGTIIPSVSTSASPSARDLAALVDTIRARKIKVIFLETGANPQLADQLAAETGARVVTDLYTHAITPPDGPAPTYLEMMRHNTTTIVAALTADK